MSCSAVQMEKYLKKYQNHPQIKCILFDLDNTLIETRKADARVCEKIANDLKAKYSLNYEEATSMSTNFLSNFRKCPENTRMSLEKWRTYLWSQALGEKYQHDAELVYKNWLYQRYQNLAIPQEITFLLKTLRKHFRIALITNGTSAAQWEKIDKLDLKDSFDLILVSGDLAYEKPDKNIFLQACDYLNMSPENCLMVGDKLETDIQGGLEAGLGGTIWIPLGAHYTLAETDPQPDYILRHVMELKYLLSNAKEFETKFAYLKSAQGRKELRFKKLRSSSLCGDYKDESSSSDKDRKRSKRFPVNVFHKSFLQDEDSNSNASDGS